MIQKDGEFERAIEFSPAWDKRHNNPKKDYGIHCMDMRFILKGPLGITQFCIYTGWFLKKNRDTTTLPMYMAADLGYHSPKPTYENQSEMECCYLGKCYYDGSTLLAQQLFDNFIEVGNEEVIWNKLKEVYYSRLG